MAGQRVPLFRSESNGNMDAGENNLIFALKYDMSQPARMLPGLNEQQCNSGYPIAIYAYKATIITDYYGQLFQTYGDSDDQINLTTYDLSNDEFISGLKQINFTAGTSGTLGKTVISYRAKKNPLKLRSKFGKWKRPPIYLGPTAGNMFYICTHNSSDSNARTFCAHVEIQSWKQFT